MSREQAFHDAERQAERRWRQDCPLPPITSEGESREYAESVVAWAWQTYRISPGFEISEITLWTTEGTRAELQGRCVGRAVPYRTEPPVPPKIRGSIFLQALRWTDTGQRQDPDERTVLHEVTHLVVGPFPFSKDGRLVESPGSHSSLFARRYLDLITEFHPESASALIAEYEAHGVRVADRDAEPSSWWHLDHPHRDLRAAATGPAMKASEIVPWLEDPST